MDSVSQREKQADSNAESPHSRLRGRHFCAPAHSPPMNSRDLPCGIHSGRCSTQDCKTHKFQKKARKEEAISWPLKFANVCGNSGEGRFSHILKGIWQTHSQRFDIYAIAA
ncbi:hypothetical protein [Ruegeria sp.]|uniref:hypothetical protein n=1 Tax=Ruegeria sp. TaxID=1879320 RepID=UPI003B5BA6B8